MNTRFPEPEMPAFVFAHFDSECSHSLIIRVPVAKQLAQPGDTVHSQLPFEALARPER